MITHVLYICQLKAAVPRLCLCKPSEVKGHKLKTVLNYSQSTSSTPFVSLAFVEFQENKKLKRQKSKAWHNCAKYLTFKQKFSSSNIYALQVLKEVNILLSNFDKHI